MYELALFAGAGGGLLATKWLLGWEAVCYVENDPKPVEMLKARIRDGLLDDAPIWDDVRTFDGRPWRGCVDIITAGFPCQPFSQAGKRRGADDERNMWPDTIRIVREVRPRYVLLENVPALLSSGYYGTILGDLAASGYDAPWDCIPASAVGANHQRDRLFIVAYSQQPSDRREKLSHQAERKDATRSTSGVGGSSAGSRAGDVAHADGKQMERAAISRKKCHSWQVEPDVGRMVDGISPGLDGRIKALGNAQVPAVVACVWRLLGEVEQ